MFRKRCQTMIFSLYQRADGTNFFLLFEFLIIYFFVCITEHSVRIHISSVIFIVVFFVNLILISGIHSKLGLPITFAIHIRCGLPNDVILRWVICNLCYIGSLFLLILHSFVCLFVCVYHFHCWLVRILLRHMYS